jgi:hypothetical protein
MTEDPPTTARIQPYEVIGAEAVKRLYAAGYVIAKRHREPPIKTRCRWTCPHCRVAVLGGEPGLFADWGRAWCSACHDPRDVMPSRRGDRRPMEMERVPA